MNSDKRPFHVTVAEKLIEQLRAGTAPWQKPWEPGADLPLNPTTGKRYRGINALQLMSEGRSDPRWLTYKQAEALDAQVRKGEKGTPIQYWKFTEEQPLTDDDGKPVLDGQGKPFKQTVKLERPRVFFAVVFNAEQVDGLPPLAARQEHAWSPVERAERILETSGAVIKHDQRDAAFYRPLTDSIHLPQKSQFPIAENYYATALHELGHWTGHKSRLERDLAHPFGSEGYAKEELRAEIASMILGAELGLGHDTQQHAAYVGSWIKALQDDPLEIFRAAADAEKIHDYVLGLEQRQVQEQAIPALEANALRSTEPHPPAFMDTKGTLRDWTTGDQLPEDWQGMVKHQGTYWYIGQEARERSFTVLASTTYPQAEAEAKRVKALAVDIDTVLKAPNAPVPHLETRQDENVEQAMRSRGLTAVFHVTGSEPHRFYERAEDRLSPVFGLQPGHSGIGNAYVQRNELARRFAAKAEQILLQEPEMRRAGQQDNGATPEPTEVAHERRFALRVRDDSGSGHRDTPHPSLESAIAAFADASARFGQEDFATPCVVENDEVLLEIDPDPENMGEMIFANQRIRDSYEVAVKGNREHERAPSVMAEAPADNNETDVESRRRMETWTLHRLEQGSLTRALDKATLAQVNRIQETLAAMLPLDANSPFWQRYALPQNLHELDEQIYKANEQVAVRQSDTHVAAARRELVSGEAFGRERSGDAAAFDREASSALGFTLPHDWTGDIRIDGIVTKEVDGKQAVAMALEKGVEPQAWGVFARLRDGTHAWLTSRPTEQLAHQLAERLAYIDAHSTLSAHEKAAKLARINEQRVRRDANSTDEDMSAAREARKNAGYAAAVHDPDLQRRIEYAERDRAWTAAVHTTPDARRTLIAVPYTEKNEAKALGAKWDRQQQSWYVPAGVDQAPFAKWTQQAASAINEASAPSPADTAGLQRQDRVYLAVPYNDRVAAKAAGANWDKTAKSWFAASSADMEALAKWRPQNVPAQQEPAMTPREEFAEFLRSVGCVISGEHPIMDGKKHRITVEGEKFSKNSGSGFYVGHLDGHPAGYAKNNKTGIEQNWKAKGYVLDPAQKARLAAEAAAKVQQREADLARQHDQAAARVAAQISKLIPVEAPTPYMGAKGIQPQLGALTDEDGKKTYLPAIDASGKQWTMQYIQQNGVKRFAKNSRKEGCFHVVGHGLDELTKAPAIVISEGYATAASLRQTLGYATVSAFDSGNLAAVAQALHQQYPDKPIVLAGDDDRHLELTLGVNPGRTKAEEAAKLVGGMLLLPIFAPGENAYPSGLAPVNPGLFREHQRTEAALSEDQLDALARMKIFTDFNDLATRSALGKDGIDRQVRPAVEAAIKKYRVDQVEQLELDEQQQIRVLQHEAEPEPAPKRHRLAAKIS
jgi:antirestriction protein ArdC/phage/plasmid primase-like uncharacterized protein